MVQIRHLRDSDSSVRDALTLGALLAFILIVSVFVTLRIYTQLDQVASVQRTLVESQQELYDVLRSQFDEEIELRGYLATRQPNYLDPYRGDDFGDSLGHLELTSRSLAIVGLDPDAPPDGPVAPLVGTQRRPAAARP